MEDIVLISIIAMVGVFALIGARMFKPNQAKTKPKTRVEAAKDALSETYKENIDRLTLELRKQAGRANRLQALKDNEQLDEEETPTPEISSDKEVTWEEIQALAQASYPQYARLLSLPGAKDKVMEQVKGMTIAQVIQQIQSIIGGGKPQGGIEQVDQAHNPNFA